ncbi:hypothetical protein BC941DRAFT_415562 [Chlamydoabsidia padenii]|nr:hypothetical protein BC941DRAFT_415562 [Chlamydoabsidia padenii]
MLPTKPQYNPTLALSNSFNLEAVMRQYASQPDLLELILSSKVEEDRRRTEEAKLRQKEIEYMLQQQQQQREEQYPCASPTLSPSSPCLSTTSTLSTSSSPLMTLHPDLSSSYRQPMERRSSIILPPLITSLTSSDLFKPIFDPLPTLKRPSDTTTTTTTEKRRRREMHPITAIVETKEFPYNDNYLWRNNGNTTHKKTGDKSIYYKCANPGCPVNKTCTFQQDHGEYLIKYRGVHLPDCSTIKRINQG